MPSNRLNPAGDVPDTGIPEQVAATTTMAEQYEWHRAHLRRHPVSRRNFLRGSAAAAAVAAAGVSPFGTRAYAEDARLAVAGRHVGFGPDAASQLRFAAQLSRNPQGTKVFLEHGPTPMLGATVEAEVRDLITQIPSSDGGVLAAEQFYVHAPVDGLPGRVPHFYRWRTSDGFVGDVRSAAPAMPSMRGAVLPFRFTMMGDQGTDDTPTRPTGLVAGDYDDNYYKPDNDPTVPHAANVLNQIVACRPDFHILAGDIAYADPSGAGRAAQFVPSGGKVGGGFDKFNPYVWDVYFGAIEASASTTPWMFATGNHDMEAAYDTHGYGGHLARLDLPGNGPAGCPSAYSFGYGNLAVLSLDANDISYEIRANTGYSGGAQNGWVARTLAAYRSDPNIDFIVCFFHHCAYSTTDSHASDGGVRDAWCELFDRYRVDLVLQGHNHIFERTDPIRAGRPTKPAGDNSIVYPETDGTVYYTVGGGGRPRYGFQPGSQETYRGHQIPDTTVPNSYVWTADGDKQDEAAPWSRVRFRNYSFIRVDVRPGFFASEMDVVAVDEYGREFDKVTYRRTVNS
ncbi:metallophosphoesterase [Nocardia sp. CDC159]|uniref:Metallophosphoesterase n=1 Tax=Nocardia pulmonis TaxID=2951408 RepID=A0A9X2E7G6_9NOCA|nr:MULTISPECIES: metallophosphoesterase [Nocardia]MCM6775664.1 metallophosphoesterase [Nocardia pulmonis]MCM6788360.1 metallophosphoesterase [Nocardia sp. CDC159]